MKKTLEELLQSPYWIIDILPYRVPADSPGQFFAVEKYFLTQTDVKQKHLELLLKLNCYRRISLYEEAVENPAPAYLAEAIRKRELCILIDGAAIVSAPDDIYMTLYAPDARLLRLVETLAAAQGLFVWQPEDMRR